MLREEGMKRENELRKVSRWKCEEKKGEKKKRKRWKCRERRGIEKWKKGKREGVKEKT